MSEPLLKREQLAQRLTAEGFPISTATLQTMASRGGGPPYRIFGQRALYDWDEALYWAKERVKLRNT